MWALATRPPASVFSTSTPSEQVMLCPLACCLAHLECEGLKRLGIREGLEILSGLLLLNKILPNKDYMIRSAMKHVCVHAYAYACVCVCACK